MRRAFAFVIAVSPALAACARAAAPAPSASPAPTASARPFFPADADLHWHVAAPPAAGPARAPVELTDADRAEFAAVKQACRDNARDASRLCSKLPPKRSQACIQVCIEALQEKIDEAAAAAWSPLPPAVAARARAIPATAPPATPPRPTDPFARALRACIRDVMESGGGAPAVCHFDRPLDEMDFGQRHCNERCAQLTGVSSQPEPP